MNQVITLEIPEETYQSLERVADAARADVRSVLLNVVNQVVHPLADSAAFDEMALLADEELRRTADERFPPARLRAFDRLRKEQEKRPLTSAEQQQIDSLREEYQEAELRKACALAILNLRRRQDV